MAKKRGSSGMFSLQLTGLLEAAERIERAGGQIKPVMEEALNAAAKKITSDTIAACDPSNMPAGGIFGSKNHETLNSVIKDSSVVWSGNIAEVPVGFDFSKPGAGGFLITGTPKMNPNRELEKIYKQKRYTSMLQKEMAQKFNVAYMKLIEL